MTDELDELGQLSDRLDNMIYAAPLPLPDSFKLEQTLAVVADVRDGIRKFVTAQAGFNPWDAAA